MSYYSEEELSGLGFKHIGTNVLISKKSSIYNPASIEIGNNVRIDDFCVLSAGLGGIAIGNYIHIAIFSSIVGRGRVILSDFCNISSRVSIYSSSDDYSGEYMTNPMVSSKYTNVKHADVLIGHHVVIGSGSVILPGVEISDGVSVGALSLVNRNCLSNSIYAGIPAVKVKDRARNIYDLEKEFLAKL